MKIDLLVAEIGSTTTVITAYQLMEKSVKLIAQTESYTTIDKGDVTIGIEKALKNMEEKANDKISWEKFLATSSAAGGLSMTVHGLVFDMTVRAAKEAALGAGAILKYITSGKLRETHLKQILKIKPKLILLSGGVDYGEEETVLYNAELLSNLPLDIPIIYAGNTAVKEEIEEIFKEKNKNIIITENVYPKIDHLNVEPARKIIQEVFSKHIIHAPGMEKIYDVVDEEVIPTPAAVMNTTELLNELYGDVLTVDIGGATTDIDSVTDGSPEIQKILVSPQPRSKRTVDGDMGIYINAHNVVEMIGKEQIKKDFENYEEILKNLSPYPQNDEQEKFATYLAKFCFLTSLKRHAGRIDYIFTPTGRKKVAQGKDLTAVKIIFGTGGILSRSKYKKEIFESLKQLKNSDDLLLPSKEVTFAYDKNYIFANIGVIANLDKEIAKKILQNDIEWV
ncbi:reactivating factor for adenosylcobalamine-dependent D-ornithine aminomutase [Petrotoga miotherma DSM 10691]|uniref:Reactivating factor for adenosylcobalamine-dependent D-ornithine aminomutase n=1 Tax=Petrotoga miotherma DSM 10691 TaxID=1434326 RepID=A0A2K1P7W7_9BACT|nr:GlmL-related ornithine degradation protein [Petrotoga miotherma]PNR98905.1 reactivating factor for adenosylcobalamine-dependent D-ornithine aminomutase [Petrotoga miotherma DSM 10691]